MGLAVAALPAQPAQPVFDPAGTVTLPAVRGQRHSLFMTGAQTSYIGNTFIEYFFRKSEQPVEAHAMSYVVLRQSVPDAPILEALGGEAAVEVTLSEIFEVLELQPRGEAGALLNDRMLNIFYVRDKKGMLRTVFVYWDDKGWGLNAGPIDKRPWSVGSRIFFRSKPSSSESS